MVGGYKEGWGEIYKNCFTICSLVYVRSEGGVTG